MYNFSERLKIAIERMKISQTEAARRCGIAQQSLNYIIQKGLSTSKLAPKIAASLKINPEWLIYGKGKFEDTKIYEIPIIHSLYMLKKYLNNELNQDSLEYTVIDYYLGDLSFAYILKPQELLICTQLKFMTNSGEYLALINDELLISTEVSSLAFPIFEKRIRNRDF